VKTYANCFVLLVQFAADRLKRRPTDLEIEDLGTDMIMAFLDHVENGRGSCVRTRNGRLAAIRSFFRYIEYRIPACLDQALRVRSIPTKKTDKALIDYLDRAEIKALLDAPDPRTRLGTRDRAMLHLAYAGGLRVSELVTLQLRDFPDRSCPPCTSWARVGVNGSSALEGDPVRIARVACDPAQSASCRDIPQCQRAAHDPRRICVPFGRARQDRGNEAAVDPCA
jgi:integrase